MKNILTAFLFTTTAFTALSIVGAKAEGYSFGENFYLEFGVGTALPPYTDASIPAIPIASTDYKPSSTLSGSIAIGTYVDDNWRIEGQVTVNHAKDGTYAGLPHTGNVNVWTIGANALYSFDLDNSSMQPFVGAGVGVAIFDFNNLGATSGSFTVNDSQSSFIASAIVGVDVPINEKWTFTTRYSGAIAGSNTFATTTPGTTVNMGSTYISNILAGLRYKF